MGSAGDEQLGWILKDELLRDDQDLPGQGAGQGVWESSGRVGSGLWVEVMRQKLGEGQTWLGCQDPWRAASR